MRFEIEIAGRTRVVSVEPVPPAGPDGGHFRLTIDGQTVAADARPTPLGLSLVVGGRQVDAALVERAGGEWLVQLPHVGLDAVVDGRRLRTGSATAAAGAGEQRILAPMPGRIVRVLVKPGDAVKARQGLVVFEAMKMENELASPRDGRVKEVAVAEGASVEAGRLLIVVE
jgi:biotin carboxyl carrier protein